MRKKRIRGRYWVIYQPDHREADSWGYVFEHRYIFEQYHNCCLLPDPMGIVHHDNNNSRDNNKENLIGMSKRQHTILHKKGKPRIHINTICLICGGDGTDITYKSRTHWYKYARGYVCVRCYKIEHQRVFRYKKVDRYGLFTREN